MALFEKIHLVLRHDLVQGREEGLIHASVTQIDLHDFCRLSLTYGLGGFHCVTAIESQHRISNEILQFWREGFGQHYNPDRMQALAHLSLHRCFDDVLAGIATREGKAPLVVGTSARKMDKTLDFGELLTIMGRSGQPLVLQFGTAWGLSNEQLSRCDWVLPPIDGRLGYNHLSVRCAAAIIVDRLIQAGASHL